MKKQKKDKRRLFDPDIAHTPSWLDNANRLNKELDAMRPSTLHYFSEKKSFCPLHIDDYALFGQTFVKAAGYCDLDSDRKTQLPIEDNCVFSEKASQVMEAARTYSRCGVPCGWGCPAPSSGGAG